MAVLYVHQRPLMNGRKDICLETLMQYLICSPDHIIHSDLSEEEVIARREFTRISAKSFLQLTSKFDNVTPIAVVHGRNIEEDFRNRIHDWIRIQIYCIWWISSAC